MSLGLRIGLGLLASPFVLVIVLYLVLLVTPIPLSVFRDPVQSAIVAAMPEGSRLDLGDMALAVEGGTWPVLRFSPVVFTDNKSGAKVSMGALEVGFSPIRAIFGQPGASVTIVEPHIQVQQDLFGPRLASFDIVPDPNGGRPLVRILEGAEAFPQVGFEKEGIDVKGELPPTGQGMRSDNDWLVFNLEAAGDGITQIIEQAKMGRFSRLIVKGGTLDMNDALYGVLRTFNDINLDITPSPDGLVASGLFSADFGGTVMQGTLERVDDGKGTNRLQASLNNFDLSAFLPFINDPESMGSMVGASAISMDLAYDSANGKLRDGLFHIDMTGSEVRLQNDYFPIASGIMAVHWNPAIGEFTMSQTKMSIGQSSATVSGVFRLGLDEQYGPVVSMAMNAKDVSIHPNDMAAPEIPFSEVVFEGWSAPLYGATGIDKFVATKPGMRLAAKGRIDMLRRGMGFDMSIGGEGITADDLKRLWPYITAGDAREWFVKNVTAGVIESSTMKFAFPVGTLPNKGEDKPVPQNGIFIEMAAGGVVVKPTDQMAPIAIEGNTRLLMLDNTVTLSADGGEVATDAGPITVTNAAVVIDSSVKDQRTIEISGDISAGIPSILALAKMQQPDALASAKLPINLDTLGGAAKVSLVATIQTGAEGTEPNIDYVVDGSIADFGSSEKIQDRTINNGQLAFRASEEGYTISGTADVDGIAANVLIDGKPEGQPTIQLASTIDVDDLKKMGFDASEFLSGKVQFIAQPKSDGSLGIKIDLKDAGLTIADLGISKERGASGVLEASIKQQGKLTEITDVDLAFGDVALKGSMEYDTEKGLQSAELSQLRLSAGDKSQASLTPIRGGYALRIRGDQLDLKPMLKRFFNLSSGSGTVEAPSLGDQTIVLDIELKRALGMYNTAAFNIDIDMALKGADLQRVNLQANFGDNKSISVTTNPSPDGKIMTVAFNDAGDLLRLLGVYANLIGGEGSLALQTVNSEKVDYGLFQLRNFAIADEEKVAEIIGTHAPSRELISKSNRIDFKDAKVSFIRRKDRIEVTEGLLSGPEMGGTLRGFIYTELRSFDLAGTYVPLFGINNAFGRILGSEGLFGVTFAVRGPLDKPDFKVNPASALAIGPFRSLFEFRTKEKPRVE